MFSLTYIFHTVLFTTIGHIMCTSVCGPFSGNDRRAEVVQVGPKMAPTPKHWRHSHPQPACGGLLDNISCYQQITHFQIEFNQLHLLLKTQKRHNGPKVRWLFDMRQLFCFAPAFFVEAIFGGSMQQTNQPLFTHRHSITAVSKLADCLHLYRCFKFYKTYQQSKIDSGYLSDKKCRTKKTVVNRQSASKEPSQKTAFRRSRVSHRLSSVPQTSLTGWFWFWKETRKKRDRQTTEVVQCKDRDMKWRL